MNWNAATKWIMLISGGLTCTMLEAAIAPHHSLRSTFGETIEGPLAEIVTRNWGALIALVGAMLIYGAFNPAVRPLVLIVAGLSKLTFITLVLVHGPQFLGVAALPVGIDLVIIVLLAACLVYAKPRAVRT